MFRIQGYTLPEKKSIRIGLTMIYGIGLKKSKTLLDAAGIPYQKKVSELTEEDQKKISDEVKNHVVENDLRREVQ
jgi:small subunit ribosomal protein S13